MSKTNDRTAQIENLQAAAGTATNVTQLREYVECAFNKGVSTTKEPKAARAKKPATETGPGVKQRVLDALAGADKTGMTRKQLTEKLGIAKGWAKILGAPTKGVAGGLEGDGLVKSSKTEEQPAMVYTITAAGRKALVALVKAAAK